MKNNTQGFTLIEVIIYIGLFGILMSGIVIATYQLLDSGERNNKSVSIQEEGTFLNRKINWALSNATEVSVDGNGALVITRPDLGAASPIVVAGAATHLNMTRGSNAAAALNAVAMSVTGVTFTVDPAASGRPAAVTSAFSILGTPFVFQKYLRE